MQAGVCVCLTIVGWCVLVGVFIYCRLVCDGVCVSIYCRQVCVGGCVYLLQAGVWWCVCVLLLSTVDELVLVGALEAHLHALVHPQLVHVLKELLGGRRGEGFNRTRAHDHESHDHESHDHGSHDHGSHDHGSHDHESHDHGSHDYESQ